MLLRKLRAIPWGLLALGCLTLGLAPFSPEPHVWEKLRMLFSGSLAKPIDIFDLVMHGAPWLLLLLKAAAVLAHRGESSDAP